MAKNFYQVTPFMWVDDVQVASRFFVEMLGFEALSDKPWYAYVQREGVAFRICKAANCPVDLPREGTGAFRYYIDVADVQAVIDEVKPKLVAAGVKFEGPCDQEYGQREFMVTAPDGDLVVFGQGIQ